MSSHKLTLKSPIYEDETIAISPEWTVSELKSHLAHKYTPKPKVEHQRLIYCGRLLKDEHLLKDILKKEEKTYIHIICTSSLTEINKPKILPKETLVGKIQTEQNTSQTPTLPNINYGSDLYNVTYNNTSLPMYSNEYMQIYHQSLMDSWNLYYYNINQYYQSMYNPNFLNFSPLAQHIPPTNLPYLNNTPVVENENNQNNLINDPNVANNAGANNMMAAPGGIGLGAAEEPNGNERVDFVDWIYVLFRVGILFSILYFYSSIHRFMVVLLFSTLIFLYQAGFLVYPLRRNNPAVPLEQAPTSPDAANGANNSDQTLVEPTFPRVEAENEVQPDLSSRVKEKMLVVWNGTRAVLIVFATFFTSLIPDRPPPVNLN